VSKKRERQENSSPGKVEIRSPESEVKDGRSDDMGGRRQGGVGGRKAVCGGNPGKSSTKRREPLLSFFSSGGGDCGGSIAFFGRLKKGCRGGERKGKAQSINQNICSARSQNGKGGRGTILPGKTLEFSPPSRQGGSPSPRRGRGGGGSYREKEGKKDRMRLRQKSRKIKKPREKQKMSMGGL